MPDSDSDVEFESADEEIEEKKHKKAQKQPTQPDIDNVNNKIVNEESKRPIANEESKRPIVNEESKRSIETGWRSWGALNMLGNASKTVANLTTHVSQSISTQFATLNIPDPEEMAKLHIAKQQKLAVPENSDVGSKKSDGFKLDSLLSGVSQISSNIVSGGLETLEGIGKKTVNILHETDPNIKERIRGVATGNKLNLSEILKEAKEREDIPTNESLNLYRVSFDHLLDEYKGVIFLEALEILSNQSKLKIEMLMRPLSGKVLTEMEETIAEVNELCELPDGESIDESLKIDSLELKLAKFTEDLQIKLNFTEIVSYSKVSEEWLRCCGESEPLKVYEKSIHVLANMCALSLNNMQKLAELLLSLHHRCTADEAESLVQLVLLYCSLLSYFSNQFTKKLTSCSDSEDTKKMTTIIFLEQENGISYIRKAFNLFIPILQVGAV